MLVDKERSPTRDDKISFIPLKVFEDSVEPVGSAWDKNDLLWPSAEKLGHAMSGRSEVFSEL
jgi:hypothetical protein